VASGADAKTGDTVRNLTTLRVGIVTGTSQFGRLNVRVLTAGADTYGATERWERWDTEIVRAGTTATP
jgi:hypothetical protein